MTDAYQFWRDALAGKKVEISADHPQPGLYKIRDGKGERWEPVHITSTSATINGKPVDPLNVWTWCADKPISRADYDYFKEHNRFPGEIAPIGDNSGDVSLAMEIEDAAKQASEFADKSQVHDKVSADTCANMRARLLDLAKKADKERDAKKRPHLDAGRAIDAEYKPLVDMATQAANLLRDELTAWMRQEELKRIAEVTAIHKAELERAAKEQAERAAKMAADPIAALTDPEPEPPLPLAPIEPPKVQAGGQAGRKAGLRTVTRYEIEDYAAALAHVKDHKDVIAAVEKACVAMAKAGATVPGIKRIEERVAA